MSIHHVRGGCSVEMVRGDALEVVRGLGKFDLVVTDPPYAFGGEEAEHQVTATVAVVLRECAGHLKSGCWMVVFAASSWRSTRFVVDAVRGILTPVRFGVWCKPDVRTRARSPGWGYSTVNVIAFRKGKSLRLESSDLPSHVICKPVRHGRRAELPEEVAEWAVKPFVVPGGSFLDPFAGSGRLPEAAERLGMVATGIEIGANCADPQ